MPDMRSPFPGMDPYLEKHWQAVHAILIAETWRALNRSLPADLTASVEERVAVESDQQARLTNPDVFVYEPSNDWSRNKGGAAVIDAPFKLVVYAEPAVERAVQVINKNGQIITVIEFISPSCKTKPGIDTYLNKRNELIAGGVHVVEIDLVRADNWRALFTPHTCEEKAQSLYRATVRVAAQPLTAYVYPIFLHQPLPEIQIPLRAGDPKVTLALQPMIETIYADGRYGRTLDYKRPLDPPFSAEDSTFVADKLAAAR